MRQAPLAAVNQDHRHHFGCGSNAQIIGGMQPALIRLGQENGSEADPKDLSRGPCPTQSRERANAKSSAGLVCAAHAEFVAALAGTPPLPIPLDADAIDLDDRAAHLGKVFGALSVYLAVILDDTAQNVPGRLDLPNVEAHLADLAADVAGIIERAAEDMRGWIA